jgi:hypothetical protein
MAKNSLGVAFIQWQRNHKRLTGTISEAGFDQSDRTQFVSEHHDFVGTIVGSDVGLALDNGSRWNGTLTGNDLSLSYTASDGSLLAFDFHPASAADYNAQVALFKGG